MASANLLGACLTYLESDVRTTINAEQTGLLDSGSVVSSREPRGSATRRANAPAASVEINPPSGAFPSRAVGIGAKERDVVLELRCSLRRKASSTGKTQLEIVEGMGRALVNRYDGCTNLVIAPSGATFLRASAEVSETDETPEEGELARSVVRLVLTFSEALRSNA